MQITVNVPDSLYPHLKHLAEMSGRSIGETINSMMSVALSPLEGSEPVRKLSDAEVLELAASRMNDIQNARLSELLEKQQMGELDASEQGELVVLMYVYQQGNLRKAQALAEGVRRGILEPAEA
jgi:hypothetical protein